MVTRVLHAVMEDASGPDVNITEFGGLEALEHVQCQCKASDTGEEVQYSHAADSYNICVVWTPLHTSSFEETQTSECIGVSMFDSPSHSGFALRLLMHVRLVCTVHLGKDINKCGAPMTDSWYVSGGERRVS